MSPKEWVIRCQTGDMHRGSSERQLQTVTKKYRDQIKEMRDAEIERLSEKGVSQRDTAKAVGCGTMTVNDVLKEIAVRKTHDAEIVQESTPSTKDATSQPTSSNYKEQQDEPEDFFDEEECDTTAAVNPADACSNVW